MWLADLNYNFECDWLIELSDNKLSNNKLSDNKLSDNNLASELVENRSFLNQSQSRKLEIIIFIIIIVITIKSVKKNAIQVSSVSPTFLLQDGGHTFREEMLSVCSSKICLSCYKRYPFHPDAASCLAQAV